MTDPSNSKPGRGVLIWGIFLYVIIVVPLTGGIGAIPLIAAVIAVLIKRRNQAAYNERARRQRQDDDAAYGRRMRGNR